MSRVAILAAGSRGDIQPYVALGVGLLREGYEVRFVADPGYREVATRRGLEFCATPSPTAATEGEPAGSDADDEMDEPTLGWSITAARFNPLTTILRLLRLRKKSLSALGAILESSTVACQGADAIIGSYLAVAGRHIAESMQIPFLWAVLYPIGRTSTFPYFLAPYRVRLGPLYNRLTHVVAEHLFWELQRPAVDSWRKRILGLPPLRLSSPYVFTRDRHVPVVFGYSPAVAPRPADWGRHMQVVGSWFLEREPGWRPPAGLVDFLAERDGPLVSIGFGSLAGGSAESVVSLAVDALAAAGRRGVVHAGDAYESGYKLSDRVYLVGSVPYEWLFPRLSAVVHHAGVGTTAEGLRWGLPTVTVPHFGDQYFWARRVAAAGAGPPPIPRRTLSPGKLAAAIRVATTDPQMRAAASVLSRSIAAERGIERVVEILRSLSPP
jgi:sterol 3beta-glucosyltransferase